MKIRLSELKKIIKEEVSEAITAHPGIVDKFKHPTKPPRKMRGAEPTVEPGELPPGTRIPLVFSDVDFGTEEFGFLPRNLGPGDAEDAGDSEDARYRKHLAGMGIEARVVGGVVRL